MAEALHVRVMFREACNVIANPRDQNELVCTLKRMKCLLLGTTDNSQFLSFEGPSIELSQQEFLKFYYAAFLDRLVEQWSVEWFSEFPKGSTEDLVEVFFLQGNLHEALLVLGNQFNSNRAGYKVNYCIILLEKMLRQHKLQELFWLQCLVKQPVVQFTSEMWMELIILLASIPDRITAILQNETSKIFYPGDYVPFLAGEIVTVLHKVHTRMVSEADCSVQFLSQLLAKLCMAGHGELLWTHLLSHLTKLVCTDFRWARIMEKLILSVPERSLESVIVPLIKLTSGHETLSKMLGNSVLTSAKLQFILTNKLVLLRYYEQDKILQNIIGYLASSNTRNPLFIKLLKTLLNVWGDASALKHTSYEQHCYISKAILVCLAFTTEKHQQQLQEMIHLLMLGVQVHLDSPLHKVRRLGMIVAESLTAKMDLHGEKLKFEFEKDKEVEQLLSLLSPPHDPGLAVLQQNLNEMKIKEKIKKEEETIHPDVLPNPLQKQREESDLDSDDDLEPYDMSNDVKLTKVKSPLYIRDCMEGLINSDDQERVEACLLVAETLIRKHTKSVNEIAVEFSKILLHLQDNTSLSSFLDCRTASLVALAVTNPVLVADYLTGEFYERNYTIRQRLDILQVLASAAQELSQVNDKNKENKEEMVQTFSEGKTAADSEPVNWREIVQQRIDCKTRRFVHRRSKPEPALLPNRFSTVAGHFFFPLMKNFDKRQACLDLLGQDHLVLQRLLYTLGTIIHAAVNTPIIRQMAQSLLEFTWALRFHPQPGVRQALLFAVSLTILATPSHVLVTDLHMEILDVKGWLEDVYQKDEDTECKKLAVQALVLLENSLKKEFQEKKDM